MNLPQGYKRIGKSWLPRRSVRCNLVVECVYKEQGVCNNPNVNSGNGDAACHKMSARKVMQAIEEVKND